MRLWLLAVLFGIATALRCYDGTVDLNSNLRTPVKDCSTSNYCVQRIDKNSQKITRECSSWSDEHSMEEKCPMSGCHWRSKQETYCCCQFDLCNEYKANGNQFHENEMRKPGDPAPTQQARLPSSPRVPEKPTTTGDRIKIGHGTRKTTPQPDNGEIQL